jgi:hypothetical protein
MSANKQRQIDNVLGAILAIIPEEETTLIARLEDVLDSARYTPPDAMSVRWYGAAEVLEEHLGRISKHNDWQRQVFNIWLGKEATEMDDYTPNPDEAAADDVVVIPTTDTRHHALVKAEPAPAAATTPHDLLTMAVSQGSDIERLERLMEMQLRWEANEARKAYAAAMVAFKRDPPRIVKDKQVSYKNTNYRHATLGNVAQVIAAALAEHGLTAAWTTAQEIKRGAITVTCTITHVDGHSESTSLQEMADTSGSKNNIQALASTVTYLERYTVLALTGLATHEGDDDGASSDKRTRPPQDDRSPDPGEPPRESRTPGPTEHDRRVARCLRVLGTFGVTEDDLVGELGPSDGWGDVEFRKLEVWRVAFKGCQGNRERMDRLIRETFTLEPGSTES